MDFCDILKLNIILIVYVVSNFIFYLVSVFCFSRPKGHVCVIDNHYRIWSFTRLLIISCTLWQRLLDIPYASFGSRLLIVKHQASQPGRALLLEVFNVARGGVFESRM